MNKAKQAAKKLTPEQAAEVFANATNDTDLLLTLWSVIQASDPALDEWFEQTPLRAAVFLLILWLNQVRFRHDESLKLLEAIETGSPVGLALVEYPGGRILRLNPAMAVLLGGPPEAMLDRTWWDFGSSLVPGGPPQRQQLRTCRFQMRWVELAVHDLMASEGGRRLMVVQALDCQQAAEAEAALASQAEELRRQLAVSLEACTLSHEIRQPLSLLQLQSRAAAPAPGARWDRARRAARGAHRRGRHR